MKIKNIAILGVAALTLAACATTAEEKAAEPVTSAKMEAPDAKMEVTKEAMATTEMKSVEPAPEPEVKEMKEAEEKKDKDKKKKKGITQSFDHSQADVHAAAMSALAQYGFVIKNNEEDLLEAKRSSKIGLVVGSGGEKMAVKLKALSDTQTEVHVRTKKTFVGIAGQKNWDDEVIAAIADALNQ